MGMKEEFQKLSTPIELLDFLARNIKYGWTGKNGEGYLNTVKNFRSQFQLSSLDNIKSVERLVEVISNFIDKAISNY